MRYSTIRNYDIANGEGVRVSLFVSGCTNHCPGCFNKDEQDFNYGTSFTEQAMGQIFRMLREPTVSGLSLLGGDPLCQNEEDMSTLVTLCAYTHALGKTVWLWTGLIWEDIYNGDAAEPGKRRLIYQQALLKSCDVVVDGPFKEELSNRSLTWRGSSNQRIIDVRKTIRAGGVVLWNLNG